MLALMLMLACQKNSEAPVFADDSVARLRLESGNGVVEVVAADALRVERSGTVSAVGFQWEEAVEGDLAILGERCPFTWTCHVDALVELPPGMPIELVLGTGEVWLSGLSGAVRIDLDAGTVDGQDLSGNLFELTAEKANMNLELTGAVDTVLADVSVGDLSAELPAGAYALDVGSGFGEVTLWNVEHAPDAAADVVLRTGAGDVSLTGISSPTP